MDASQFPFVHPGLPARELGNFIRLLEIDTDSNAAGISCRMRAALLDETVTYKTLSYTWGEPLPTQTICVNDTPFEVRQNLYDFLKQVQDARETSMLWIDALCIDQNNVAERNSQVKLMSKIYSMAAQTIVWLGQPHELYGGINNEKVFEYLNTFDKDDLDAGAWRRDYKWEAGMSALTKIPYFSRLWVIQELALSSDIIMWCGHCRMDWSKLRDGYFAVDDMGWLDLIPRKIRDTCAFRLLDFKHGLDGKKSAPKLFELLVNTAHSEPLDFVFGAVSLLPGKFGPASLLPDEWKYQPPTVLIDYKTHPCDLWLQIFTSYKDKHSDFNRLGSMLLAGLKIYSADLENRCIYWLGASDAEITLPLAMAICRVKPKDNFGNSTSILYFVSKQAAVSPLEFNDALDDESNHIYCIQVSFRDHLSAKYECYLLRHVETSNITYVLIHYPKQKDPSGPGTLNMEGKLTLEHIKALPIVEALCCQPFISPYGVELPCHLLRHVAWHWAGTWRDGSNKSLSADLSESSDDDAFIDVEVGLAGTWRE